MFFNRENPVTTMRLDSVIKETEEVMYKYKIGEIFSGLSFNRTGN